MSSFSFYRRVLFQGLERFKYANFSGFTSHTYTVDKDQEAVTSWTGHNPWAIRQHRREINRTIHGESLRAEVDLQHLLQEAVDNLQPLSTDCDELQQLLVEDGRFLKGKLILL